MTTTLGKYTLVRKLAVGGMAEVFLARADGPLGFQKKVVVKRILPQFADDPRFLEMFLGEARLAAQLSHPNLVQIFDFGSADGQYFIAMEYIDGANLRVLNREARTHHGPLPLPLVARIVALAAEGLQSAHDLKDDQGRPVNLVHRDISPDNILVSRSGAVKVVDFGIAKAANQPHLTKTGAIKGKMAYMPPEQLAREPLDRRTDIYALGIVLYELVTGGMPFDATSEVSIIQAIMGPAPLDRVTLHRPDVPPGLDAIITRCLQKAPSARYADCRELQRDLEAFIQSTGQSVGTGEIAQVVDQLFPEDTETTQSARMADVAMALDPTAPSRPSAERPGPQPPQVVDAQSHSTGLSHTVLRQVHAGRRRAAMVAGVVGVLAVGGIVAAVLLRGGDGATPVVEPPPVTRELPDAAVAVEVDAGQPAPRDAGALAEAPVPDAGAEPPVKVAMARLELRIRPYATVYLDGKKLGDTPLKVQTVRAGKHKLRLVNPKLGKDEEVELVLKPGANVYKHNLKL